MTSFVTWLRQPFHLLDTHRARLILVIFCGLFGCLFLNVFHPFNVNLWFNDVKAPLFIVLTFFSAAGMGALALSQFAIRSVFNIKLPTRLSFLGWSLVEFIFIALAIHTVDIFILDKGFFDVHEFLQNLKHTLLIVALPYFLGILLLHMENQLAVVRELKLKVENSVVRTENVNISDEKGKVVMNVPVKNIVYFKSEDNYTLLYYKQQEELKKELIRTNLKKLEQELATLTMVRIHRSYMINSQNLLSAIRTARGYKVKMDLDPQHHLPVSSTYQQAFEQKIVQF
jgi:DNA-binding LytR/AlgR family response regulator